MLAQSHARKPAPPLAARGMWLRLGVGPDAFGSALGDAVVGSIAQRDQRQTPAPIEDKSQRVVLLPDGSTITEEQNAATVRRSIESGSTADASGALKRFGKYVGGLYSGGASDTSSDVPVEALSGGFVGLSSVTEGSLPGGSLKDAVSAPFNSLIKGAEETFQMFAKAQAMSPELTIAEGLGSTRQGTQKWLLDGADAISFGRLPYSDYSPLAIGPLLESGADIAQLTYGGYGLAKGGLSLAAALKPEWFGDGLSILAKGLQTEAFTAPKTGKSILTLSEGNAIVPIDKVTVYARGGVADVSNELRELQAFKQSDRKVFDANPENATRLDQLKAMDHNFQRSTDMAKQLNAIGLTDTPANNKIIINNLIKVGQTVTPENRVWVPSLLKGPQGNVRIDSTWKIMEDNRAYLTTLRTVPVKR